MFSFLRFEKWVLVKVFKHKHSSASYVYHVRLYESTRGRRRVSVTCNGAPYNVARNDYLKGTDFYQMRIRSWEEGRNDPEVPPINKVDEYQTFEYLKEQ